MSWALIWMRMQAAIRLRSVHSCGFWRRRGIVFTLGRLSIGDVPTNLERRDNDNFFSPQDCLNFLGFSQDKVRQNE